MSSQDVAAMAAAGTFILISSIVWLVIWVGLAIGIGCIAARLKKNVALWVVLALIPIYNLFFYYYVAFFVVLRMLDRLNEITARLDTGTATAKS